MRPSPLVLCGAREHLLSEGSSAGPKSGDRTRGRGPLRDPLRPRSRGTSIPSAAQVTSSPESGTFHRSPTNATVYPRTSSRGAVAVGMARGTSVTGAEPLTSSSRPPSLPRMGGADVLVSLRQLKAMVQGLEPSNPLRIMVLGEPDEVPRLEYAAKVLSWYRLILSREGSAPPDGR